MLKHLFGAPESYPQMLWKIAAGTGVSAFLSLWLLAALDPASHRLLFGAQAAKVEVLGAQLPLTAVVIAVLVALLSRAIKLHDRVSDVLGIRRRFDLREIIRPMAVESGLAWNAGREQQASSQRDRVMRRTFYRYASSTNPQIDKHLIVSALDKWSWFWIIIEADVLLLTLAVFLGAVRGRPAAAVGVLVGMAALGIVALLIELGCRSNAEAQVDEIFRDPARREEIKNEMNALLG